MASLPFIAGVGCAAWLVYRRLVALRLDANAQEATRLDAADPLAYIRREFSFPRAAPVYMCGHSLGLMPRRAAELVHEELDAWAKLGERGHFEGPRWLSYHTRVRQSLASLVGAKPLEVVAMNSLTVNLHLLLASFYRPTPTRATIVIEAHAFPSDRYAVQSWAEHFGLDPAETIVELAPAAGRDTLTTEEVLDWIQSRGDTVAVFLLSGVQYYTGQWFDMEAITKAGRARGAAVGWDLAHCVGNVPLELHDWGVDFAAWCSYKYLNAGPGAIAGAFVHERHCAEEALRAGTAPPRLAGWWGNDESTRFRMGHKFVPAAGADGWQLSNPPILQLAALRGSLEVFDEAQMPRLHLKAVSLTTFALRLLDDLSNDLGAAAFAVITPRDPKDRGTQLSLRFVRMRDDEDVAEQLQAMLAAGHGGGVVETDYRRPDVLRFAPCALYCRHADVLALVVALRRCLCTLLER